MSRILKSYGERTIRLDHKQDLERMVEVLKKFGLEASLIEVSLIWEEYSDSFAAGWLILPNDDTELYLKLTQDNDPDYEADDWDDDDDDEYYDEEEE